VDSRQLPVGHTYWPAAALPYAFSLDASYFLVAMALGICIVLGLKILARQVVVGVGVQDARSYCGVSEDPTVRCVPGQRASQPSLPS
jgi:hypothetical protein